MGKTRARKVGTIILIVFVVIAGIIGLTIRHFTGKMNFQSDKDVKRNDAAYEQTTEAVTEPETETETEHIRPEDIYHIEDVTPLAPEQMDGMYTMLVIGGASPEVEQSGENRPDADAILLLNFNTPMRTLYLTSFDNDLYTIIPGKGPGRLANAYAIGGGPLLAETITQNYGVPIDNYGVISLKDAAAIMDLPELAEVDVSHQGVEVIRQLIFSLNITDPAEVVKKLTGVLSYVTHNIDSEQMVKLLLRAPGYVAFYSSDDLIPYEGMYREIDGYVVPYIGETSEKMQRTMFERPAEETDMKEETEARTETSVHRG